MKKALYFFEQTMKKNRLAHLYLITGTKGSGKEKLAKEVSYLILNQGKPENKQLRSQIRNNVQPNVMYLEPDGLTLKKEQILNLQSEFSKSSLVKGPRIYIINHVEKMSQSAANSLLKFMEEPYSQAVYGFLLTDSYDQVITTIVSRSQVLHLTEVDELTLKELLIEDGVEENLATLTPFISKNIDQAKSLAEDDNFVGMVTFLESIIKNWQDRSLSFPIYMSEHGSLLLQDRELFKNFLELLLLYFVDLIHYRANQPITYQYLREAILVQSDQMKVNEIHELIEAIQHIIKKQNYYINLELSLDELSHLLEKKRK